ncbi:MAG: hypothetical protein C9356_05000 [Oleiphilus sp.]|nr:MAG: hypothetical protein C9356_05000 [Oleiphilus sp.]
MAQEIELKLKISQGEKRDLVAELLPLIHVQSFWCTELKNQYFDSPDLLLHQRKVALRIREKDGRYIQTLKTQGTVVDGLHQRGEWEWELAEAQLDETLLRCCDAWPDDVDIASLSAVFQTNFERKFARFPWQGSEIELALDQGTIEVAGKSENTRLHESIYEIELELVSGEPSAVLELGRVLQSELELEVYDRSKAERGYRLYCTTQT